MSIEKVKPRIVVLGANGAVGRALAEELAMDADLELRLVDVRDDGIRHLASPDVEVVVADFLATGVAQRILSGASLFVNCLSFTFFDAALAAAIENGVNYADLISEPSPEQAAAAAAKGITVVSGLGLSPGLSNVLVRHASETIRPIAVDIMFAVYRAMAGSRGALDTMLWEGGEYCPERNYFLDGQFIPAGPLDGARAVDFGGKFGRVEVYFRPHPEPKSLPKNFPSIRFAAVRGTWQPEIMADLAILNRYGLLTEEALPTTKEAIWARLGGEEDPRYPGHSTSNVEVSGVAADGTPVRRTYRVRRPERLHSYAITGRVAALGVRLLVQRPTAQIGLVDPELAFDPEEFLEEVRRQGLVDVSWVDEPWDGALPAPAGVRALPADAP